MNRLAAICLILLALFNLVGYRAVFFYLQEKSDQRYQTILDKGDYDESQMLTIKVDLNMPYLPANSEFERVDGEIKVDGQIYKYVKRKIHNGQLVLLCLPDETKTKLGSASQQYFAKTNSLHQTDGQQSSQKSTLIKAMSSEYEEHLNFQLSKCIQIPVQHPLQESDFLLLSTHLSLPGQPPETI